MLAATGISNSILKENQFMPANSEFNDQFPPADSRTVVTLEIDVIEVIRIRRWRLRFVQSTAPSCAHCRPPAGEVK